MEDAWKDTILPDLLEEFDLFLSRENPNDKRPSGYDPVSLCYWA